MKVLRLLSLVALATLAAACAADRDEPPVVETTPEPPPVRGTLAYEPTSEMPLLELSYEGGMIKDPDPTPFVRVFPDGRVLVHYPAYMKKAGDYELILSEEELNALLSSFSEEGILALEPDELKVIAAEALTQTGPIDLPDTHGVSTRVEIRAESFTREGEEEPSMRSIESMIMAENLAATAEALPQVRRLQDFARGVAVLENLADRDDLMPVASADNGP
jgi:hypothetical protein